MNKELDELEKEIEKLLVKTKKDWIEGTEERSMWSCLASEVAILFRSKLSEVKQIEYEKGWIDATKNALEEINKNYRPI